MKRKRCRRKRRKCRTRRRAGSTTGTRSDRPLSPKGKQLRSRGSTSSLVAMYCTNLALRCVCLGLFSGSATDSEQSTRDMSQTAATFPRQDEQPRLSLPRLLDTSFLPSSGLLRIHLACLLSKLVVCVCLSAASRRKCGGRTSSVMPN